MARCRYFDPPEIFHPHFLKTMTDPWELRPAGIWVAVDALRKEWGRPLYVNGPGQTYCGVRPVDCLVGAKKSRHKPIYPRVQALDLHGRNQEETRQLYQWIVERGGWRLGNVERVEDWAATPGWVHAEFSSSPPDSVRVFKP